MFTAPVISGAAFIVFSLYFLKCAVSALKQAQASAHWPNVVGKVLSSEAVRRSTTSNHRHFRVKYEYAVGEQTYTGERGAFYTLDGAEAKALVDGHNKEARVNVYYNPDSPNQAVLVSGARPDKKYSDILLASFGVLISILILFGGLTGFIG